MDDARLNAQKVQQALYQDAAHLQPDPFLAQRVLHAAQKEGEPKMKKKLSFAAVVAIALMLTAIAAVAATLLWQDYAPQVKEMEQEHGEYTAWPLSAKVSLVESLADMGYLTDQPLLQQVSDASLAEEARHAAADRLLLDLTGQDDPAEIHLNLITRAVMGPEDTWTPEQRVWWQQLTNLFRTEKDPDTLVAPDSSAISEEEAIRIGKAAILAAYELPADALDAAQPAADQYVTEQRPDLRRWHVYFNIYDTERPNYLLRQYFCHLSAEGEIIADPDVGAEHLQTRAERRKAASELEQQPYLTKYREYSVLAGSYPFWQWPYDLKAACYQEIKSLVAGLEQEAFLRIGYATYYAYGLPGPEDIPYDEALRLSIQALMDHFGLTRQQADQYSQVSSSFDVTDTEQPLWKLVLINPDDWYGLRYRVHIVPATGEVLLIEAFPWQMHCQDMQYDLKYY